MKKICFLIALTTFFPMHLFAQAVPLPQVLNFDGQLLDSSNSPIPSATVTFEIYDGNAAATCLLYKEVQNITTNSYGEFSTKIGPVGTDIFPEDGDIPWAKIFANNGEIRAAGSTSCTAGYTPAAGQARKLRVTINSDPPLTPDFVISPVPMATVAETLQGKVANDFLLATPPSPGFTSVLNGNLRINNNRELQLTNSTSSNFVSLKSPAALTASYSLVLPMDDGVGGQVLTTDGAGILSWTTPSGASPVTLVFGRSGNVVQQNGDYNASQITSTPAGGVVATTVQAAIAELGSGKISSGAGVIASAMIATSAVTTTHIADGTITSADINDLSISKITSATGEYLSYRPNNIACANGEILKWDNSNTRWSCATEFSLPGGTAGQLLKTNGSAPVWSTLISGLNTAATPALTFQSDSSTGLFVPTNGELAVSTGGTEKMRLLNNGNLGIGITPALAKVDIMSTSTTEPSLQASKNSTSSAPTFLINNSASAPTLADFRFNAASVMNVRSTGVGIGTVAPAAKLDIFGATSSGPLLKVEATTGFNPIVFADASGTMPLLDLRYSSSPHVFLDQMGLGIGTTTPAADLDVNLTGIMRLRRQPAATPPACNSPRESSIALTNTYIMCVCDGSVWREVRNPATTCTW